MKDRIVVNTGRLGEWARELHTVRNELESIAGRLSQINLSDEAGGDLDRRGSYSLRTNGRRFSGSDARRCVEALAAATRSLAVEIGQTSGAVQGAQRLFEEKERWISSMIDGLLGGTGNDKGIAQPTVVTPANIQFPPTLEFEDYNSGIWQWLKHQSEKNKNRLIGILADPFSDLSLLFPGLSGLLEGAALAEEHWTAMTDDAGVSKGDRRAMAKVMIDEWSDQIKSGEIEIEGHQELVKLLNAAEKCWEEIGVEERNTMLSNLLNLGGLAAEEVGIIGAPIKALSEMGINDFKRLVELGEAKLVMKAMQEQSLNVEGMDSDLRAEIEKTLKASSSYIDTMFDMAVNNNKAALEAGTSFIASGAVAFATGGASSYVETALGVAFSDAARTGEAINEGITTLEGAVDVFTKDTRPQLERAIENYRTSPTPENYQMMKEKAETYGAQAKAVSKQYYDLMEKTGEGKSGQYEKAVREIDAFVNQFK